MTDNIICWMFKAVKLLQGRQCMHVKKGYPLLFLLFRTLLLGELGPCQVAQIGVAQGCPVASDLQGARCQHAQNQGLLHALKPARDTVRSSMALLSLAIESCCEAFFTIQG